MTEIPKDDLKAEAVKPGTQPDTVSQLFEERDRPLEVGKSKPIKMFDIPKAEERPQNHDPKVAHKNDADLSPQAEPIKASSEEDQKGLPEEANLGPLRQETEALRAKLAKTEKVMLENQRYGRMNAQKLSNAVKAVQKFAQDGALNEDEATELLAMLQTAPKEETGQARLEQAHLDEDGAYAFHSPSPTQSHSFLPIFQAANQELGNIQKYTDDPHLPDKVKAFDYFLSIASQEEAETLLGELTGLMDDPLKLARKMLAVGQEAYDHSYKAVKAAGSFKDYLAQKDEMVEKLGKKIDKLEKKLLQYEDFDQPRYRLDELGDADGAKTASDTLSTLFDERDQRASGTRKA